MSQAPLDNFWAIVVTAFVVVAMLVDMRHDVRRLIRGRNVVLAGILAWFLFEGITLSPGLNEVGQASYNYAVFCIFLSAAAFLVGYHYLRETTLADRIAIRFRQLDDPQFLWRVVLACAVLGFTPIIYYSGMQLFDLLKGIMGMRKTWGGLIARGRYGGFREALLMLECFIDGASPLAVILILDRRVSTTRKILCWVVAAWPILRAFGSATRSSLILSVLPVLAVIYFKATAKSQKKIVIAGLLSLPLVYYLMAAIVASRNAGEFDLESGENVSYVGNEMMQELAYITQNVPQRVNYQWGYSYYVQLVNPIPRFLWPGKPTLDSGILLAQLKGDVDKNGEATLTNSPGLIGEMYLNFGLFGIIGLSFFGGWLVRGWDRLDELNHDSLCTMIFYTMGLAVLFIMGRSFNMAMCYSMLFLYVGVWLVVNVFGHRASPPHSDALQGIHQNR